MMKPHRIVRGLLLFLAISMLALPASAQNVVTPRSPQAEASYQCSVSTQDAKVEKAIVRAPSEDAAKSAAAQKIGSRAIGLSGVSCVRGNGSAMSNAGPATPSTGVKTRAPSPPIIESTGSGVEFEKDGSCRLSQEAMAAYPDARGKCRALPGSDERGLACPANYCARLR